MKILKRGITGLLLVTGPYTCSVRSLVVNHCAILKVGNGHLTFSLPIAPDGLYQLFNKVMSCCTRQDCVKRWGSVKNVIWLGRAWEGRGRGIMAKVDMAQGTFELSGCLYSFQRLWFGSGFRAVLCVYVDKLGSLLWNSRRVHLKPTLQ